MAKDEGIAFSAREMEVLALAWQCFETEPKIDIKKLAALAGYTESSASVTMGKIKRKLKDATASTTGTPHKAGNPKTPKTPNKTKTPNGTKTPNSGKRKAASVAGDESPIKMRKSATKPISEIDDDDEDFNNIHIKSEETDGLLEDAQEYYTNYEAYANDSYGYQDDGQGI